MVFSLSSSLRLSSPLLVFLFLLSLCMLPLSSSQNSVCTFFSWRYQRLKSMNSNRQFSLRYVSLHWILNLLYGSIGIMFCFLFRCCCSLSVDQVLGRTIRVDHVLDYKAPKKDDSADVEDDTKDDDSSSIEEENVQENESNQTRTREELKSSKRAEVHGELQKEDPLSTMRSKIHSDLLSSESSDQEDAGEDALRENERHKRG